jgi:hypothetical protein
VDLRDQARNEVRHPPQISDKWRESNFLLKTLPIPAKTCQAIGSDGGGGSGTRRLKRNETFSAFFRHAAFTI